MKIFEKKEDAAEKGVLNNMTPKRAFTTGGTDSDLSQVSAGWVGFLDESLSLMYGISRRQKISNKKIQL